MTRQERANLRDAKKAQANVERIRQKIARLLEALESAAVAEARAWERVESDQGLER